MSQSFIAKYNVFRGLFISVKLASLHPRFCNYNYNLIFKFNVMLGTERERYGVRLYFFNVMGTIFSSPANIEGPKVIYVELPF